MLSVPDPYQLLGVPRDASAARIRAAYELEISRAHRIGATAHAVELSRAFDTLASPAARAAYDRHGIPALRERSPGAHRLSTPWRQGPTGGVPGVLPVRPSIHRTVGGATPRRSPWRPRTSTTLLVGIAVGILLTIYVLVSAQSARVPERVLCQSTSLSQPTYVYLHNPNEPLAPCSNGGLPHVLP